MNDKYLTVTALTKYLKYKFDTDDNLRKVYIKGEISNFKAHTTGHLYFSIKDEGSIIKAIMFASNAKNLNFEPKEGAKVLVTGSVSVYPQTGNYQIYVESLEEDGIGNLYIEFEKLKKKLESEGLFDAKYKKAIPKYPTNIGIVTASTGAAIRDILSTIKRRYPICKTYLFPCLVQGEYAAEDIVKKIKEANNYNLDVLIGSRPLKLDDKDKEELVKENILNILKEKYAIIEDDFLSAEIEVVPAGKARDFGLDKSMVMAYGQDDKVCAFTSLKAFLDISKCRKTISCILVDKEEIGSVGATGMESSFYEDALREICSLLGNDSITALGRVFKNSKMLSSDVTAAYDPLYADVSNKRCETFFNRGVSFCKYTGARGKSGSNDASCEYIAELRKIMDENDVKFQITEMGKVDAGGGGTIAYILANKNVSVIDCGVGVLSMHAPWEVTSKSDIYEAYKCYKAFLKDA